VGNVSTNVCAKFRCDALHIKKTLGIFRELITARRRTTTRVAFWDPPSGSKNYDVKFLIICCVIAVKCHNGELDGPV